MADSSKLQLVTAPELAGDLLRGILVLDVRPAEQFASLHIRGSVQISLMGYFASWAAIIIDPSQKVILIAEDATKAQEACNRLVRVGIEHVLGYSLADENEWRKAGLDLASISIERCERVGRALLVDPSLQLVDVRSRAEWLRGHLLGAISMPLLELDPKKEIIDPSKQSLVYEQQSNSTRFRKSSRLSERRRQKRRSANPPGDNPRMTSSAGSSS